MNSEMHNIDVPFGYLAIAFPSSKDPSYENQHPSTSTAVVIAGDVPWGFLQQWENERIHSRGDTYRALKGRMQSRLLGTLLTHYPQLKDRIEFIDSGSPLDTKFYLGKSNGESYGIAMNSKKVAAEREWLHARPTLAGWPSNLFITGQDITSDGFAAAVSSAMITAARIEGPLHWLNIVNMLR